MGKEEVMVGEGSTIHDRMEKRRFKKLSGKSTWFRNQPFSLRKRGEECLAGEEQREEASDYQDKVESSE